MKFSTRFELIHLLGGKCSKCGQENMSELDIDHIYNDGDCDRKNHTTPYKRWLRMPILAKKRLQVLCESCHEDKHRLANEKPFEIPVFYKEKGIVIESLRELSGTDKKQILDSDLLNKLNNCNLTISPLLLIQRAQFEGLIYESSPHHYRVT